MKKNLLLFVVAMVATLSVWAQVPQTLTYQAVVRDANGRLICNSNVGVQLSIVQGTEDGTAVYTDRQTVHTNANGLFTMLIGSEENSLGGINWAAGPYYLKSEIDPTGGNNYTLETVQQLFSVPYALRAHTVDSIIGGVNYDETDPVFTAWNKDYNDLINRPTIPTNVSELTNDAGYLTSFTESQILTISNDTIFLTGGSYVKLPAGFNGDYNDLINKPNIADSVSQIVNEYHLGDTIINYITQNGYVDSSYVINYNTQQGYVDTTYVTNYINNMGSATSETDPVFTTWDKDYNDLINRPTIPTAVSELTNDAGYLTSFTEVQVLSISNDTIYLTGGSYVKLPAGFSGDYNDLTNKPTIPTVPTNVSEFTNDAGYLTSFTESQILSIGHDTIFLTGGSYVKLPAGFSGDYNDLTNKPTIPTVPTNVSELTNDAGYITSANVPTNVSELTNDAGYLTSFTESQILSIGHDTIFLTGGSYVKLPAGFSGDYNDLTNKPSIPTVPTSVSAFTNDAGYLTSYTETDPVFTAWDKDYNDLTNKPTIPTVPTNVSEFTNDAGYITSAGVPTNVSELTNDAGYLTSFTESQILSIGHDTIFLTGGSYVKLPAGFSGDYNDLTNKPTIPTVPTNVSELTNDAGYLTSFTESQILSIGHDTIFLTGGSFVKLPAGFSGDYNDLTNKPTIPTVPTNISELANDAGYLTTFTEVQTLGNVVSLGNAANGQLKEVSDPTEALDAVNLRTLNAVVVSWTHLFDSITNRYDSIAHRYDSIMHNVDSIIHYQDSVIDTLSSLLAELGATTGDTTAVECESFYWYGTEYTVSGDYRHRLTNVAGFDSVLTMHLTINHGTHNVESQTSCDSYTWYGNNYTASGTFTHSYTNGVGCASADTLHLTINVSTAATDTHTECDSYTWIDGNTYNVSNSTATHTLTNVAGCDSVMTLNLTLNSSTHNAETQSVAESYTWHGNTYTTSGNYTYSYTNAAGCASVDTLHLTIGGFDANGASFALFSVTAGLQVKFSKGNLQYTTTGTHTVTGGGTAAGTWRFAEHQYDYVGSANSNISSSYTGWIDLFGWGTSGWSSGATAYQPWASSKTESDYYPGGSYTRNLTGTSARADWGVYNAISNGGNQPGAWRVLTKDEWSYLLDTRSASTVGGTANARYAKSSVNGISGVILFPDTFTLPTGLTVTNINTSDASYASNTYTTSQWSQLESAGCIFLPAAGYRAGTNVSNANTGGYYWSSTSSGEITARNISFYDYTLLTNGFSRSGGCSVRLVKEAN